MLTTKSNRAAHGLPRWWEETVRFVYLKALKKIVWFSQGLGSLTFHRKKKKFHPTPESLILIQGLDNFRKTRGWESATPPPSLANKTKLQANSSVEPGSVFKNLWAAYSFCVFDSFPLKCLGYGFSRPYLGFISLSPQTSTSTSLGDSTLVFSSHWQLKHHSVSNLAYSILSRSALLLHF